MTVEVNGNTYPDPDDQAAPDPAAPAPLLAGTFAIYPVPDEQGGGYWLTTEIDGRVSGKHIPGALVELAQGGGPMGRMLGQLFGGS